MDVKCHNYSDLAVRKVKFLLYMHNKIDIWTYNKQYHTANIKLEQAEQFLSRKRQVGYVSEVWLQILLANN